MLKFVLKLLVLNRPVQKDVLGLLYDQKTNKYNAILLIYFLNIDVIPGHSYEALYL